MSRGDLHTGFLRRCIASLTRAYDCLQGLDQGQKDFAIEYDIYRSACVKEFELILEQVGKLLRKCLEDYFPTRKTVYHLPFKDIFRHALLHDLLGEAETQRWLTYRDNRNSTAHDYGEGFAEETLQLLPAFIADAKSILGVLQDQHKEQES